MKRWIALLAALALLIPCAGLAEEDWCLAEARSLAQQLWKLSNDEGFVALQGMPDARNLIQEMAEADFSEPTAVWRLAIPGPQELYDMLVKAGGVDDDFRSFLSMTDLGFRELARRLPSTALSTVLTRTLTEEENPMAWLAFRSVMSTGRGSLEPEGFEPCLLVLDYPGSFGVAVTCTRIGDGVVQAFAQAVPSGLVNRAQGMLEELRAAGIDLDIQRIIQ